jgi:hemerythrin superfamily protein
MAQARKKTPPRQSDAIELLEADHKTVDALFREFEKLHEAEKDTEKVIDAVRIAVKVHDAIEMDIFYPAVRKVAGEEEEELLDEAEVEHGSVQQLLRALRPGKLKDKKREANFTVLIEYVRHHVKEEENELFPKLRTIKRLNLAKLGERMMERKLKLEKKFTR